MFTIALSIGSASRDSRLTVVNVYCASAAAEPLGTIVDRFNSSDSARSERVAVEITRVGGSGELAGQLSTEVLTGVQNMADVFVSADSNRMFNLVDQSVIIETFPIATQFPVIAICNSQKGNLLQADDLPSLLDLKKKLGVGSVNSAIGFETRRIAELDYCLDRLQTLKTADFENVMSLAQALSIGSVDAAIVWNSTVHQFNQTDNRPIKILAYLDSGSLESNSPDENSTENGISPKQSSYPVKGSGKFSANKAANSNRPGCFIEVGRSISDNHQADLFFRYLKNNRDEVLSDFIDAGFSNLHTESSLDNERESNQP